MFTLTIHTTFRHAPIVSTHRTHEAAMNTLDNLIRRYGYTGRYEVTGYSIAPTVSA